MLLLLSPAKTLDFAPAPCTNYTQPSFLPQSQRLINLLRLMKEKDIQELMRVSEKIAQLNVDRYQKWKTPFDLNNAKQALLAFKGDVYQGLSAEEFDEEELAFAQEHLGILSGLYGFLRPLDLIQAYRLEMGTKLENKKGKDLYAFWGAQIAAHINAQAPSAVVNLASKEYFKALPKGALKAPLWQVDFKEERDGKFKIIALYAKRARGRMSYYAVKNRLTKPEQLRDFDLDDYKYNTELSSEHHLVFTR